MSYVGAPPPPSRCRICCVESLQMRIALAGCVDIYRAQFLRRRLLVLSYGGGTNKTHFVWCLFFGGLHLVIPAPLQLCEHHYAKLYCCTCTCCLIFRVMIAPQRRCCRRLPQDYKHAEYTKHDVARTQKLFVAAPVFGIIALYDRFSIVVYSTATERQCPSVLSIVVVDMYPLC